MGGGRWGKKSFGDNDDDVKNGRNGGGGADAAAKRLRRRRDAAPCGGRHSSAGAHGAAGSHSNGHGTTERPTPTETQRTQTNQRTSANERNRNGRAMDTAQTRRHRGGGRMGAVQKQDKPKDGYIFINNNKAKAKLGESYPRTHQKRMGARKERTAVRLSTERYCAANAPLCTSARQTTRGVVDMERDEATTVTTSDTKDHTLSWSSLVVDVKI